MRGLPQEPQPAAAGGGTKRKGSALKENQNKR